MYRDRSVYLMCLLKRLRLYYHQPLYIWGILLNAEMVSGLGLVGSYLYVCCDFIYEYTKHQGIIFGVFVHFADYLAIRDYVQPVTKSFRHLKW